MRRLYFLVQADHTKQFKMELRESEVAEPGLQDWEGCW